MKSFAILVCVIYLGYCQKIFGQTVIASNPTLHFGEILNLKIATTESSAVLNFNQLPNLVYGQDTTAIDSMMDVDVLAPLPSGIALIDGVLTIPAQTSLELNLAVYSVGKFLLPFASKDTITVLPILEADAYADNLPIEPKDQNPYNIWWFIVLAFIGIILAGYLLYRWIGSKRSMPIASSPKGPSPQKIALSELNQLLQTRAYLSDDHKKFQTDLSDIVRKYIHASAHIPAMEMTADQITAALQKHNVDKQQIKSIEDIFSISDLVKFAKARPGSEIQEDAIMKAIDFVTKVALR